jgi:hypothetical protein
MMKIFTALEASKTVEAAKEAAQPYFDRLELEKGKP